MGGNTGITGEFDFYTNGHLSVLHSSNKCKFVGYGMAPARIAIKELIDGRTSDGGWTDKALYIGS